MSIYILIYSPFHYFLKKMKCFNLLYLLVNEKIGNFVITIRYSMAILQN